MPTHDPEINPDVDTEVEIEDPSEGDGLAGVFDALPEEIKIELMERAGQNKETCFLCRYIYNKERPAYHDGKDLLPDESRKGHLLIHCGVDIEWKIEEKKEEKKDVQPWRADWD
jgi:hypothetical protein